jgi:peptidoglycan/xylan/chitin deacetylase (PgdA/CDA1 family)
MEENSGNKSQRDIKIITSWDDFSPHNMLLASLLLEHKIPAIFFIEIDKVEKVAQVQELAKLGFQIGCHTFTHPPDLKLLDDESRHQEISEAKQFLDRLILKQPVEWFCYPKGRFNSEVIDVVQASGYRRARTTRVGYGGPDYEKNAFHCFQRKEYGDMDWLEYIKVRIEYCDDLELHIWGHAWEIEKYQEWEKIEELFKYINLFYGQSN